MSAVPWRQPKEHELKCWPDFFDQVIAGVKTFEVRENDREFMAGDTLRLREWRPYSKDYTGRECRVSVPYLLAGRWPGVEPGYVVMSIKLAGDEAEIAARET